MTINFVLPPSLAFPSTRMLTPQAKDILNNVQKEEEAKKATDFFISYPGPEAYNERKQSRVSKACRNCQLKKNKCDGRMPCGNCTRKKTACEYQGKPMPPVAQQCPADIPPQHNVSQTPQQESTKDDKEDFEHLKELSSASIVPPSCLPSMDDYGHFSGETTYRAQQHRSALETAFPTIDFMLPPNLSHQMQAHLVDTFYQHINPFYLVVNKDEMIDQLHKFQQGQATYLSPLFFYSLFTRTAALIGDDTIEQTCRTYTYYLRNAYFDYPRLSTVLALVMLANHIEHRKSKEDLTRVWQISGEALRMVTDLGLHRVCHTEETDFDVQFRIRTFWAAFIMDRTLSLAYGRPHALAEQDIEVSPPQALPGDDAYTQCWLASFHFTIVMSKVAGRITKSFYPSRLKSKGPVQRQNMLLPSIDSWIISAKKEQVKIPDVGGQRAKLERLHELYFYSNLILLHRPHMEGNDGNAQVKQSLNICWSAAIIIIQLACTMSESERTYLTMSPVTLYAFIAAMRVHLAFALGTYKMSDFSKLMFTKGRDIMKKLPQNSGPSMFKESLDELNDIFSSKVPSLPPQPPSTINHCNVRRTSLPSMSFSRELAVEGSTKPPACITNEKHSRKGSTQMRFHQYNPDSNQFEKGKQPCKRVRHDSQPERKPGKARKQTAESDLTTSEFSATTFANASITATNNIWSNSSNPAMYMSQPSPASLTSSTALFEEPVQSAIEQGSSLFIQEMINSMGQQYAQSIPNGQNDQTVEVEFPMQIVGGDHGFGIQLFDFMDTAGWQFPFTVQSQQFECAEHVQQYPTPPPFNMGDQIDTNGGMIPSTYPS